MCHMGSAIIFRWRGPLKPSWAKACGRSHIHLPYVAQSPLLHHHFSYPNPPFDEWQPISSRKLPSFIFLLKITDSFWNIHEGFKKIPMTAMDKYLKQFFNLILVAWRVQSLLKIKLSACPSAHWMPPWTLEIEQEKFWKTLNLRKFHMDACSFLKMELKNIWML